MKFAPLLAAGVGLAALVSGSWATAAPITYTGVLYNGVTVTNSIPTTGGPASVSDLVSDYWSFSGNVGDLVSILGARLEGAFDMSFWVFQGVFTDDSVFGAAFDSSDPGYIDFADDDLAPAIPGPWGDPYSSFSLPSTGLYTVVVTNFASGADNGDGLFPYQLTARGVSPVPLPAALPLLAGAIGAMGLFGRRKRNAA